MHFCYIKETLCFLRYYIYWLLLYLLPFYVSIYLPYFTEKFNIVCVHSANALSLSNRQHVVYIYLYAMLYCQMKSIFKTGFRYIENIVEQLVRSILREQII